jgi:hypothetical protein
VETAPGTRGRAVVSTFLERAAGGSLAVDRGNAHRGTEASLAPSSVDAVVLDKSESENQTLEIETTSVVARNALPHPRVFGSLGEWASSCLLHG